MIFHAYLLTGNFLPFFLRSPILSHILLLLFLVLLLSYCPFRLNGLAVGEENQIIRIRIYLELEPILELIPFCLLLPQVMSILGISLSFLHYDSTLLVTMKRERGLGIRSNAWRYEENARQRDCERSEFLISEYKNFPLKIK